MRDPVDARRARHVLSENQRVIDCVAALGDGNYAEAGRIFTASHASMREDFDITTERIDLIAAAAVRAGALGADDRRRIRWLRDRAGADRARGAVAEAVRRAVVDAGFEQPVVTRTGGRRRGFVPVSAPKTYSPGNFLISAVTTGQKL